MYLEDFTSPMTSKDFTQMIEKKFGKKINVDKLGLSESRKMLKKVRGEINSFLVLSESHTREKNPSYLAMKLLRDSLITRIRELNESAIMEQITYMNAKKLFLESVGKVAKGKKLTLAEKRTFKGVSKDLRKVLESRELALEFIRKYVNDQRRINEGSEVEQAQLVLAAQDMVDRVQKMIEELSDLKVKDLPALVDNIRSEMGQEKAVSFRDSVSANLEELLQNLTTGKNEFESSMGIITGEKTTADISSVGPDVEDDMGSDDMDMDMEDGEEEDDLDLGGESPNFGRPKRA